MSDENRISDRIRPVLVLVATLGVIAFNWMAASGRINDVTPQIISDRYPTLVTPAGYAFSIWSLIYLGLIAFSIYQLLPKNSYRFSAARTPYILSCVLNCAWIYFWHHDSVVICLIVIFALWLTLLWTYSRSTPEPSVPDTWLVKAPFGLYTGWVTAATLVNLAVVIKTLNISLPETAIGVILIILAAAVGVGARLVLRNFFFPLAVAWALTAIAVKQSGQTAIVLAAAVGVVACLIASVSFVLNLRSSSDE